MFIEVSLLRPQRGDKFLTYCVPEIFENMVSKGDVVEVPMRNTRELGMVFRVFDEVPEFETKMMGNVVQKKFFTENFLDFLVEISDFFFCSPSFFLSKTVPLSFFTHVPLAPQERFFSGNIIPEIPEIKGKKQQELCRYFVETNCNSSLREYDLKKSFSPSVIKTALEKNYITESFQEKFPENSCRDISHTSKNRFYNLDSLDLHPQKNIILGSNHSAKNAVIAQWIENIIEKNQQVVFVFPDQISLEQAYEKFQKIFPENSVEIYSSGMTKKNKEDLFFKLKSGYTKILLGTKNALFFVYKDLGGMVVHEYHNDLYVTQSFPFTHAKDIAKIRAKTEKIPLLFSATTGDIDEVFALSSPRAQNFVPLREGDSEISGKLLEFSVPNPENSGVQIVDMNLERYNNNISSLSYSLEVALEENLKNKQQSILFLNRKGLFTALFCSECKWSPTSPLSGTKLGVFKDRSGKKVLRCTASKYHENFPDSCPQCKKNTLVELGKGTQEIEEVLTKKFPEARIFRADKDSLSSPAKTRNFVMDMEEGSIDIVIGTQLVLQAFPFENVSLLANIMTENDILFPSFRAEEKGYVRNQKFLDVAGRKNSAKKMLQTFCPQHPFLQKIQENNFQRFYQSELVSRNSLYYPPFSSSIEISKNAKTQASLEKNFLDMQSEISGLCEKVFPLHISYHPQRNLFTAKMLCFTADVQKLWSVLEKKGVTFHRYAG